MAAPKRDNQLAARVLVHYAIHGSIRNTADNFKLAPKTVQRYKQDLFQDDELITAYLDLLEKVKTAEWAKQLNLSMSQALRTTTNAMRELEPTPQNILLILEGLDKIAEIAFTHEQLD